VKFGANDATTFTVNSDTSITAVSPAGSGTAVSSAGSGTVDVTVTTVGGTSATSSADRFTYVGLPGPSLTAGSGWLPPLSARA
jgi:hypothetical protein